MFLCNPESGAPLGVLYCLTSSVLILAAVNDYPASSLLNQHAYIMQVLVHLSLCNYVEYRLHNIDNV